MAEPRPWHRLFGLSLIDFFRGMPVTVELEKDLSLKQQFLNVILIRKGTEPLTRQLPDGFDKLAAHNLVTYKSHRETLDGWALNELVGHYVNYRKQVSPSMRELLPETDFRLFAVSARFPRDLARETVLTEVHAGVYEARHFTGRISLVVVNELPQAEINALLHLFSTQPNLIRYGSVHYRMNSEEMSTVLLQLFQRYHLEVTSMPDLLKEFAQEAKAELLREMPVEERLEGISAEKRLEGLSPDDLLAGLSPEIREALLQRIKDSASPRDADP